MELWQRMRTQTEAYWQKDFKVGDADIEYLYSLFLEEGQPLSLDELAIRVMERRCRLEKEQLAKETERGTLYRPQDTHRVGQELIFSAFDYAVGKVLSVRPGRNPSYGPFQVIEVQLEGEKAPREFASSFAPPHPLNSATRASSHEGTELSAEQLYALYGGPVRAKLQAALEADSEIVQLDGTWFLKSLVPEVHVGHLNIAEAMIVMAQRPLSTAELLTEIELPEGNESARALGLEAALRRDGRFDEISVNGERRWFLFSLEPPAAASVPWRLRPAYAAPAAGYLLGELAEFVRELDDEWDERPGARAETGEAVTSASVTLSYPHWREGTFPITRQVRRLLPDNAGQRFPITLVADGSNEEMPGWALLEHRYICGLGEWYRKNEIPVGATVTLSRTAEPMTLAVSYERRPRRGEWVKEAKVVEGRLTFEMQRRAYTCRYDRYLLLEVGSEEELDVLGQNLLQEGRPLFDLLVTIIPELLKLSSQGVFHAKTLYAAVNLVRRSGAIPIYAELTRRACFDPVGAGQWSFDPSLKDLLYGTEEEMQNRPYSRRSDVIKDIVVPF